MRPFDYKNSWLDDEGKPLAGRVKFCRLHTTELENIYDNQGYPADNPIYTNTIGQLDFQVFLADRKDYTVRFEKYIGNGDMTEDQDNWLHQYSCDNLWDVFDVDVTADAIQLVNNITALRHLDPNTVANRDNRKVVTLGGYNYVGDKPQVMYIWNPTSISNDNGGSVIKVDNISTGRWELVNNFGPTGVDVRHFGVFGADSKSDATDLMSIQINVANQYAAYNSIPLYFPSINGLTWYKMNGLNLYKAVFAEETRVFGNTNYPNIITMYDENGYLDVYTDDDYKAVFTLRGPTVRTSWGEHSDNCVFDPSYKLIVDSVVSTNQRSWTGIYVDCLVELSNVFLYECIINSTKKLVDNSYFRGCKLTESMFSDACDFDTITIHNNVVIDLDDWPTTWKWLKLRVQKPDQTIDFGGRTVYANCNNIINWVGAITIKNAVFSTGFQITQSILGFENCGGPVLLTASLQTLICDNCALTITTQQNGRPNTVIKNNSDISFVTAYGDTQFTAGEFAAHDSVVHGNIIANVHVVGNNTIFYNAITVTGILNLQRCTVSGIIMQYASDATFNVTLLNNTLGGSYYMYGAPMLQTVVTGKIEYNNSNAAAGSAIIIDRSNFDPDESHHHYSYKYNTGAFIPDISTVQGTYIAKPFHYFAGDNNSLAQSTQAYHQFCVPTDQKYGLIYNDTVAFDYATFFTIGTTNIYVKMNVRTLVNAGCGATSTNEVILMGRLNHDYVWDLLCTKNGIWIPLGGYYVWTNYPVLYPTAFIFGAAVRAEEASSLPASWNLDMIVDYTIIRS